MDALEQPTLSGWSSQRVKPTRTTRCALFSARLSQGRSHARIDMAQCRAQNTYLCSVPSLLKLAGWLGVVRTPTSHEHLCRTP